jgi:membrane-associated phospholipid phosphatase
MDVSTIVDTRSFINLDDPMRGFSGVLLGDRLEFVGIAEKVLPRSEIGGAAINIAQMKKRSVGLIIICVLIFLAVGLPESGVATDETHPAVYYRIDRWVATFGLGFGSPQRAWLFPLAKLTPVAMLVVVIGCAIRARRCRRYDLFLLSTVGVIALIPLVETILKNFIDRTSYGHTMYPSGHTTLATAITLLLHIVIRETSSATSRFRRMLPWLPLLPVLEIALLLRVRSHWFTDTIGGICVGVAWITGWHMALASQQSVRLLNQLLGSKRQLRGKHSLRTPDSIPYRAESSRLSCAKRHLVDGVSHFEVARGNAISRVVSGERDVHPVVCVGPSWMVVQTLSDRSNPRHEREGFVEIGKLE